MGSDVISYNLWKSRNDFPRHIRRSNETPVICLVQFPPSDMESVRNILPVAMPRKKPWGEGQKGTIADE